MGCGSSADKKPAAVAAPAPAPAPDAQSGGGGGRPMGCFQIELSNEFKDYDAEEDRILKRAYMSGFPGAKFHLRGNDYEYDFKKMVQKNKKSGKERKIRPPQRMKPPSKPIVPPGANFTVKVREGQAGKKIQVPHPKDKRVMITVVVPKNAKAGQEMMIPVPALGAGGVAPPAGKTGGHTGAKAAVGVVGAGLIVGGAILYLDEDAAEALGVTEEVAAAGGWVEGAGTDAIAWTEEAAADVAEWVPEAGADAGDWIVEAGDSAGGFVMDLFG